MQGVGRDQVSGLTSAAPQMAWSHEHASCLIILSGAALSAWTSVMPEHVELRARVVTAASHAGSACMQLGADHRAASHDGSREKKRRQAVAFAHLIWIRPFLLEFHCWSGGRPACTYTGCRHGMHLPRSTVAHASARETCISECLHGVCIACMKCDDKTASGRSRKSTSAGQVDAQQCTHAEVQHDDLHSCWH